MIIRIVLWQGLSCNFLTRIWFHLTYQPASISDKEISISIRNSARLAKYKTKLLLRGNHHEL